MSDYLLEEDDNINEEEFEQSDTLEIEEKDYDEEFKNVSFGNDEVRNYFLSIASYDLLTKEEEEELYPIIEKRNKAIEILEKFRENEIDLTIAEELKYEKIIESSEWAREKLINHNLKLVVYITKKYYVFCKSLEILDVIQEGNMGLMRAVDKFIPSKGYKFCTYAYWWIKQSILRGIEGSDKLIRLPVHIIEDLNNFVSCKTRLFFEKGRDATDEEIAKELDMPLDKVEKLQIYNSTPVSLTKKINNGEDDANELMDLIEDKNVKNPFEYTKEISLKKDIEIILNTLLGERESEIVKLRFGLKDGICHTLEEIGLIYNITRERVRQIEASCLMKIRRSEKGKILLSYIREDEE